MQDTIPGLIRRVTDRQVDQQQDADRLTDLAGLLGEILATFAVNRDRIQWTGEELRFLYGLEAGWRERADKILATPPDASEERLAEACERSQAIPRDWGPDQECPFAERPRVVAFVRERDGRLTLDPAGRPVEAIDLVPWFETLLKNGQHDIAGRLVRLEQEHRDGAATTR